MIYGKGPEGLRGIVWLSVLVLFIGYQIINAFVPNADMILATRVLSAGFYSTVLYVYAPDAWRALRMEKPERSDFLVAGIWLSFVSHLGQSAYSILYRLAPTKWFLNSEVVSWIVGFGILGAICHVGAPRALNGSIPRGNRIALGVALGIAVCIAVALVTTQPDVGPLLERARPFIGDWWRTGAAPFPSGHSGA